MRGGEMSECVSVFVLCSSVCDEGGGAGAEGLGGFMQFFPKWCNRVLD